MIRFALTVFLGAFLVFQVQPVIARFILPWYGGTAMVWTVCLLFFQLGLLAGYGYAHALGLLARPRNQVRIHLALIVLALVLLPITPDRDLMLQNPAIPVSGILHILVFSVGINYILLSASGPLMQHWFKYIFPDRSPYRLYALSNIGSLLALLSYPFLVEPLMALQSQTWLWSAGYVLFVLLCCSCGWSVYSASRPGCRQQARSGMSPRAPAAELVLWVLLPLCASMMLLATTNRITQDIASVPFLWLLPLSLYLLSFIICFDRSTWYDRRLWISLLCTCSISAIYVQVLENQISIVSQVAVFSSLLFSACMVCHGELVRIKPHPDRLTGFYLFIALGGALGGAFVTLLAPRIFVGYWELQTAWIAIFIILGACLFREKPAGSYGSVAARQALWALLCLAIGLMLTVQVSSWYDEVVFVQRNFYGVLRVEEYDYDHEPAERHRALLNGSILHGSQIIDTRQNRLIPTTYYGVDSGIAVAIHEHPDHKVPGDGDRKFHVGVVGMGVGTIAALCAKNDKVRFYEINPAVIDVSQAYFSFLDDSSAEWQAIAGDARISLETEMENEAPQAFDVLAIDAFNGDAVPVHLLTIESFQLYWKHLKADGILAIHTTNWHLDLNTVVKSAADQLGMPVIKISSKANDDIPTTAATWVLMTKNRDFLESARVIARIDPDEIVSMDTRPWTDDYSNLFEILK